MFLADVFFERTRSHARGERRFLIHALLHGVIE
jgi:hypothetical protein